MRVAVCINGLLRQPEESFDIINKAFVKPHDSDVFIYSWVKEEEDNHLNNNRKNCNYTKLELVEFGNKYFDKNLKKIQLDDYDLEASRMKEDLHIKDIKNIPYRFFPQCYKFYKVNELRKEYQEINNFIYDIVIFVRTELYYYMHLQKEVIDHALRGYLCTCAAADYGGLQHTLSVLNNDNANKYCSIYMNYKNIYLKDQFKFFCDEKNYIDCNPNTFIKYNCPKLYNTNMFIINSEYLFGYHMKYIGYKEFYRFPYSCGIKMGEPNYISPNMEFYIDPKVNYIMELGRVPFQACNLKTLEDNISNKSHKIKSKFISWLGDFKINDNNQENLLKKIKEKYKVDKYKHEKVIMKIFMPLEDDKEMTINKYYF